MEQMLEQGHTEERLENITLGHFGMGGRLTMRGFPALPYTDTDATLADAVHGLVNRVHHAYPGMNKNIEITAKDTRKGFALVVKDDYLNHAVVFTAEPSIDAEGVLRYEARIHKVSATHKPRKVAIPQDNTGAYDAQKLLRDMEHYLLG